MVKNIKKIKRRGILVIKKRYKRDEKYSKNKIKTETQVNKNEEENEEEEEKEEEEEEEEDTCRQVNKEEETIKGVKRGKDVKERVWPFR